MDYIDDKRQQEEADPELLVLADHQRQIIQAEARDRIEDLAIMRRQSRQKSKIDDDDYEDDHDVEVVYVE
jgi:GTP-binding protein